MNSQDTKRYPIGRFEYGKSYSNEDTKKNIKIIARLPKDLKKVLKKLKGGQLDVPYRRGGWTARQVVHHLADSHMNAYIRMKMAVTEQAPIIKPYEEAEWAETEDGKNASVKISLKILAPLHRRWVAFLESLSDEALDRGYFHPGLKRLVSLPEAIALYAWHSRHHLAHIRLVTKAQDEEEHDEAVQEEPIATIEKPRRGRRPAAAKTDAEPAQRRKPGRKPKAAATGAAPKRRRRTKAEMEAARTGNAAAPVSVERKKPGRKPKTASAKPAAAEPVKRRGMSPEHMAKIRAARQAKLAAAKPAAATAKKSAAAGATPKRTRRTKAEMEAARTQNVAAPVSAERKKPGPKAKVKPAATTDGAPKKRGMSPEHMAKIRAARQAKLAAAKPAATKAKPAAKETAPKRARRTKAEMEAARTQSIVATVSVEAKKPGRKAKVKVAETAAAEPKKRRGMSPEHMAKIRAARQAKLAAAKPAATTAKPAAKAATGAKKAAAAPKTKAAAATTDGAPKKRGMSAEHMAKIRAARKKKSDQ